VTFPAPLPAPLGGDEDAARLSVILVDAWGMGDDPAVLETCHVWASFDLGRRWEPVVVMGEFDERYVRLSERTEIPNGYRFALSRAGGWPSRAPLFEISWAERDDVPVEFDRGPTCSSDPEEAAELGARDALVLHFAPETYDLDPETIAAWYHGAGQRREPVIMAGEIDPLYLAAGSTKADDEAGGWIYTLKRPTRWQALRSAVMEVQAACIHGLPLLYQVPPGPDL